MRSQPAPTRLRIHQIVLALALLAAGIALGWAAARWHGAAPQPPAGLDGKPAANAAANATVAPAPTGRKVLYWYDPMVPTQQFDQPGKSPFMDMQLVPRYADEGGAGAVAGADAGAGAVAASGAAATPAPALTVSTQAQQALGLRLAVVEQRAIGTVLALVGTVQLNERDVSVVQARTAGFVERVFARAPGDVLAAGAPLAELLNPEWLGAQQEFLAVKATGDAGLTLAARQRLRLLGLPAAMVDQAERSGQPVALQTLTAPAGGVLTEWALRTGMTVTPGMTLARIQGLGTVWLEAALPEAQAATVQTGQRIEARFPALPGQVISGRVTAILPETQRDSRTLRLRIELPNPGQRLRAGLFAEVSLHGPQQLALVLPAEAVIRTGKRTLVYLAQPAGRFQPVQVEIGEQVDEWIVIRSGLVAGQQVVASGQFLLDSEASLQGVMARAAGPAASAAQPSATSATAPADPMAPMAPMPPMPAAASVPGGAGARR